MSGNRPNDPKKNIKKDINTIAKEKSSQHSGIVNYSAWLKEKTGHTLPRTSKYVNEKELERDVAIFAQAINEKMDKRSAELRKELASHLGIEEKKVDGLVKTLRADLAAAFVKTAGAVKNAFEQKPKDFKIGSPQYPEKLDVSGKEPKSVPMDVRGNLRDDKAKKLEIGAPTNPQKLNTIGSKDPQYERMSVKPSREGLTASQHSNAMAGREVAKAAAAKAAVKPSIKPPPVPKRKDPRKPS